jgi:hypothetical protein
VVLVANLLGLQVIATVNTGAEKEALESIYRTKPVHILYFHEAALPNAMLRLTGGLGVDVVINTSSGPVPEESLKSVAPFGTVIDIHGQKAQQPVSSAVADRAIKLVSFDAARLLRHRPTVASTAFKSALSLLRDEDLDYLLPVTAVPITEVVSAFHAVQSQKHVGKVVLLATEDTLVNVREIGAPTNTLADVERIIQVVKELSVPQEQKEVLLALIKQPFAVKSNVSSATRTNSTPSSTSHNKLNPKQRLAAVSTMFKARQIVLKERPKKLASHVAINAEQLNAHKPLVNLSLNSLIAIAFKN